MAVPAGVDDGTQIRLAGEGNQGLAGGPAGNLYVALTVQPHAVFQRRDNDILMELPINIAQAALGAEIEVPTLDGDETLVVPPGTQHGKVLRLKNKGVPHLRRSERRGDQLVDHRCRRAHAAQRQAEEAAGGAGREPGHPQAGRRARLLRQAGWRVQRRLRGLSLMRWIEISVLCDGEAAEAVAELFNRFNSRPGEGQSGAVIEVGGFDAYGELTEPVVTVRTYLPAGDPSGSARSRRGCGSWAGSIPSQSR